jgi:hypothetical protein
LKDDVECDNDMNQAQTPGQGLGCAEICRADAAQMQSRCRADAEQMQSTEIHFVPGLKIDYIWVRERTQDRADCQRVLVPNCLNCVVKIGFNICRIHSWKSQLLQDFQAELFFDEASRRCLATSFLLFFLML